MKSDSSSSSTIGSDDDEPAAPTPPPPDPEPPAASDDEDGTGCVVYVFRGDQDACEMAVFRKICMKCGMTAWDEMERRLPWRTRAAFRTTLCRILRKQSLGEYAGIRADPFEIQKDNPLDLNRVDEGYTIKGGMLINQKWDRSSAEVEQLRQANIRKYGLSEEQSAAIEIPVVVSVDYLRQLAENRRQSLTLKVAAMKAELGRRRGIASPDLGLQALKLMPAETIEVPPPGEALRTEFDTDDFYFDIPKPSDC
jgi:hypothetical protein